MKLNRCWCFVVPVLALVATLHVSAQEAMLEIQNGDQDAEMSPELSRTGMPEIVRLSYVQGDVRFSRGNVDKHNGGAVWEKAAVNLPLQTGFSVVTGKGRAEIEFEDASTVYLGEDSVLTFDNLTTSGDVPQTEMALLTGVATLHLNPEVKGESYYFKTPTDTLHIGFGGRADLRVNSYLDAVGLTLIQPAVVPVAQAKRIAAEVGTTYVYRAGVRLSTTHPALDHFAEWDHWVADRYAAREEAMAAVMGEAGLATPLPGLADMHAKGRFFRCEPYGTCWEPNNGWGGAKAGGQGGTGTEAARVEQAGAGQEGSPSAQAAATPQATGTQQPSGKQRSSGNQAPAASWGYGSVPMGMDDDSFDFPCSPYGYGYGFMEDAELMSAEYSTMGGGPMFGYGYNWAVCHAGSWIPYGGGNRYAWVVSGQRHHHCPVQWIKTGHRLGYVPIHPRDVAGKTPLNLKHGLYVAVGRKDHSFERTRLAGTTDVKVLRGTPKDFRRPAVPVLPAAGAPTVAAHEWNEGLASVRSQLKAGGKAPLGGGTAFAEGGKAALATRPVNTIAYDHRSQSFNLVTQVSERGQTHVVTSSMGGPVGNPQSGGPMQAGGYRGGETGTGLRGGYSGGGAPASSGFRGSSGGSSASSGGSTGGGGSMSGGSSMGGGGSMGASPSAGGPAVAGGGGGHPK